MNIEDEPNEEYEPERAKERFPLEHPMRFFTGQELDEMYRDSQGPEDEEPRDPETFAEAVLRCLGSYR